MKSIGKLSENEFIEIFGLILRNITILNHFIIPTEIYRRAESLCKGIDIDDTIFVATSIFVEGILWTGDIKLINGLKTKGYEHVIRTEELYRDFLRKGR